MTAEELVQLARSHVEHPEGARGAGHRDLGTLRLGPDAALALVDLLADQEEDVAKWLALMLTQHEELVRPRLLERTRSPRARERMVATRALAQFPRHGLAAVFFRLTHDADAEVRAWAAFALGRVGLRGVDPLLALLGHADPKVREIAAEGLDRTVRLRFGEEPLAIHPEVAPIAKRLIERQADLAVGLRDPSELVRSFCALVLCKLAACAPKAWTRRGWAEEVKVALLAESANGDTAASYWARQALARMEVGEWHLLRELRAVLLARQPAKDAEGWSWERIQTELLPDLRTDTSWKPKRGHELFSVDWPESSDRGLYVACKLVLVGLPVLLERAAAPGGGEEAALVLADAQRIVQRHLDLLEWGIYHDGTGMRGAQELRDLWPASRETLERGFLRYPRFPVGDITWQEPTWILEQIGSDALPTLVFGLGHWRAEAPYYAAQAIGKLGAAGAPGARSVISAWRRSGAPFGADDAWDSRPNCASWVGGHVFRGLGGHTLGDMGPAALPYLVEALDDLHANMRARACRSLESMGAAAAPAAQFLGALLQDRERRVRLAAARALLQGAAGEDQGLRTAASALLEREGR